MKQSVKLQTANSGKLFSADGFGSRMVDHGHHYHLCGIWVVDGFVIFTTGRFCRFHNICKIKYKLLQEF